METKPTMTTCPACGHALQDATQAQCGFCDTDLRLLVSLGGLADQFYDDGVEQHLAGNSAAARQQFEAALAVDPEHRRAKLALAKLAAQEGDYPAAVAWCDALLASDDGGPETAAATAVKARALVLMDEEPEPPPWWQRLRPVAAGVAIGAVGVLLLGRLQPGPPSVDRVAEVRQALNSHPALAQLPLDVAAADGGLHLQGRVPSELHRQMAETVAAAHAGDLPVNATGVAIESALPMDRARTAVALVPAMLRAAAAAAQSDGQPIVAPLRLAQTGPASLSLSGTVMGPEVVELTRLALAAAGLEAPLDTRQVKVMPPFASYTIRTGDSLWRIAQRYCGDGAKAWQIRDACAQNRKAVQNVDALQIGVELWIPTPLLRPEYQGRSSL